MPYRILLADDSLTIQKVVELTFSEGDFELRAVGNGDAAMHAFEEFRPELVIADAVMPGLSGYEVCARVKASPGGEAVPVVILTGTFEPFDRAQAEKAGCDSIVTKPFDSHALATLVRDLVGKGRAKAALLGEAPPVAEPTTAEPVAGLAEEGPEYQTVALRLPSEEEIAAMDSRARGGDASFEAAPAGVDESARARSEADTGPILIPAPPPVAEDVFGEVPFCPPPVLASEDVFVPAEETDIQPRDIEADLRAFEQSGRGQTRPEVWDQAEAMGLKSAAPEPNWASAPLEVPVVPFPTAVTEPIVAASEHLPPDAGAFDLHDAEGVPPRDLEALAAEARRTDLTELIPGRTAPVGAVAVPAAPASSSLSDADVDRIARRLVELMGDTVVREVAWEVVPEVAERVVRARIKELEA